MTAPEKRQRRVEPWLKFSNGVRCPNFGWIKLVERAYKEHRASQESARLGLVVVALGEHEKSRAHASFGEVGPTEVAKALARVATGVPHPSIEHGDILGEAFKRLDATTPGRLDVVMVDLGSDPEQNSLAYFGPTALADLTPALGGLAVHLLAEAGLDPSLAAPHPISSAA